MRVCSDLLHAFFSLHKDYNKKKKEPLRWHEPVPSFKKIHPKGSIQIL